MDKMLLMGDDGRLYVADPTIEQLRAMPSHERIAAVQQERTLVHPSFAKGMNYVLWMVKQRPKVRAPGLIVSGPNGSGKTTFGLAMLRQYALLPPSSLVENLPPCAVMISLTGLTTMRAVYGRILEAINAPVNGYQRIADREITVSRMLRLINCRLLVLDETQDVLKGSERDVQRVLDAIKFLMYDLQLPVLALGTEQAARAFDGDPNLSARFSEVNFGAWGCDAEMLNLLAGIEATLPLRKPVNLRTPQIIDELLRLSEGCLGVIVDVIRNAAVEAIATSREEITVDILRAPSDPPDHRFLDAPRPGGVVQ